MEVLIIFTICVAIIIKNNLKYYFFQIDVEFELLFPHIHRDILNTSYSDYVDHILNVYNIEKQDKNLLGKIIN